MTGGPILLWLRRDLRLADHPAMRAAAEAGVAVIPVFIRDETVEALGAASKWRLGEGLRVFGQALEAIGSRLVLRSGPALAVLADLVRETGAGAVWWSRLYDGASVARDRAVKAWAKDGGPQARSFRGHLIWEPWEVETGQGGPYRVYSPFWRAVRGREVAPPLPPVRRLPGPERWPQSERLEDWATGAAMRRGAAVVARHARVGEAAASALLAAFLDGPVEAYGARRDLVAEAAATSGLSEPLTWGEISPGTVWRAGLAAVERGARGAEKFLSELAWREFAWHVFFHAPDMAGRNWREGWDGFGWRGDNPDAERWRRGMTGEPLVDAAMRQMYVTGRMHNRARMVVASYLSKHLLTDWRLGLRWFQDCLTDWDPASNAFGWQWVAGPGPDAAPYFRIFNPASQAEKFDPGGVYRRRWIAEGQAAPGREALDFFEAAPRAWGLAPDAPYPAPVVGLAEGRARALAAWERRGG